MMLKLLSKTQKYSSFQRICNQNGWLWQHQPCRRRERGGGAGQCANLAYFSQQGEEGGLA